MTSTDALRPDLTVADEEWSLQDLEDELATLSAHLSAGMARWLELLGEFDLRLGWLAWGGCSRWLAWRCGLDGRTAREHVRVARALGGLPLIRAASGRGELSYAKVRALTRVSAPANEDELLELAAELTASHLERALAAARRVDYMAASRVQEAERLSWTWATDGSLAFSGRLAPEDGALFLKALEVARERLWQAGREESTTSDEIDRRFRGTACDGSGSVKRRGTHRSGRRIPRPECRSERWRSLSGGRACRRRRAEQRCSRNLRRRGRPSIRRGDRATSYLRLVALLEDADRVLGLGRKTRSVPPSLRRALNARDGCCRFPGCPQHSSAAGALPGALDSWGTDRPREPDAALPPSSPSRPRRRLDRRCRGPLSRPVRAIGAVRSSRATRAPGRAAGAKRPA